MATETEIKVEVQGDELERIRQQLEGLSHEVSPRSEELNVLYDQAERAVVSARGGLHRALVQIFCDYSFGKDFLYTTSGRALVDQYGCNPYRIIGAGKTRFERAMRRRAPRIQQRTLDRLWDNAETSARHEHDAEYAELLELQVCQLWEEFLLHEARKISLADRLAGLLQCSAKSILPFPRQHPASSAPRIWPVYWLKLGLWTISPAGACSCDTPVSTSRCGSQASTKDNTRSPRREDPY